MKKTETPDPMDTGSGAKQKRRTSKIAYSTGESLEAFRTAIQRAGLPSPDAIIGDGKLHRYGTNGKPNNKDGWYVLHLDGIPAGSFGCWRSGISENWCSKTESKLTNEEREAYQRQIDAVRRLREKELTQRHDAAALRAEKIWYDAEPATDAHPYLRRKQVRPYGLRVDRHNRLIVPIVVMGLRLTSLQFIPPDGKRKEFLRDGEVTGGYCLLNDQQRDVSIVVICEGFATAASIHEATGFLPTVIALHAENLLAVAQFFRATVPNATIIIAGDHDGEKAKCVGQKKAREAAQAVGGVAVIPEVEGMDWNDIHVKHGLAAVKKEITSAMEQKEQKPEEPEPKSTAKVPFADQVNTIRMDPTLKTFQKKREISRLVIEDLNQRGRLIRTIDDSLYFFDQASKTLVPLNGEDFRSPVYAKFGLNTTEDETRFLERELITRGMTVGHKASIQRLSYWCRKTKALHVSLNNGTMMKLDGGQIQTVDNGTDEVLFLLDDKKILPVTPTYPKDQQAFHTIFSGLSLAGEAQQKQNMLALLKVWFLAVFFFHLVPVRPIMALIGPQGAGKSTLGRRLGMLLYGDDYEVSSLKHSEAGEQDFLAMITSRRFCVFDNADAKTRWLQDHLAKLATGAKIQRRKLYTTNDCVDYRPDCFLMMTSRNPVWKRDDVASRLLPILMDTISGETKARDLALQQEILDHRSEIWGTVITMLNTVVGLIRADTGTFKSKHRLADFHWAGGLIARALNLSKDFEAAMETLNETQLDLLADGDERLDLFATWVDTKPDDWNESLEAKEICTALRPLYDGAEKDFPFKNGNAVGTWLGMSGDLIKHKLKVTVTHNISKIKSKVTRLWVLVKEGRNPVTPEKQEIKQDVTDGYAVTPQNGSKVSGTQEHPPEEEFEAIEEG